MTNKKLKVTLKCDPEEKTKFSSAKCILPISVGQRYHEDKYLQAAIDVIGKKFRECVIVVCDSLQRHTLQATSNLTKEEAYHKSLELGEEWMKRNAGIYSKISIPYSVRRWDEWISSIVYHKQRDITEWHYLNDSEFRISVDNSISLFIGRKKKKIGTIYNKYDLLVEKCREYILEECSVMPLWIHENINYELYPGLRMPGMEYVHKHFVLPVSTELLKRIILKFCY